MGIELQHMSSTLKGGLWMGAKRCDYCKTMAAVAFCRVESVFLCLSCDAKIHDNKKHQRVWMCEVCEQAPAAVTCRADAAALCFSCDVDIHSANPLARRHERVPVEPFFDSAAESIAKSRNLHDFLFPGENLTDGVSWLLAENFQNSIDHSIGKFQDSQNVQGVDSVVPVKANPSLFDSLYNAEKGCFDIGFSGSNICSFSNHASQSLSQSVSSSLHEVGVVPDGRSMSEITYPYTQTASFAESMQATTETRGMDREARVLRYREKRKNRKFRKTIRYASRKAYAETRPRIKGRFAKRVEMEHNTDLLLDSQTTQYGIVPSF